MIGFASKPLLNRHNDKWHPLVANGTSLADTIKALNDAPKETYNNAEPLPPLESPLEMPPKLSPLPDWWMDKIASNSEKLRLHDLEIQASIVTRDARRKRSR